MWVTLPSPSVLDKNLLKAYGLQPSCSRASEAKLPRFGVLRNKVPEEHQQQQQQQSCMICNMRCSIAFLSSGA
jgi:hypothetical protein